MTTYRISIIGLTALLLAGGCATVKRAAMRSVVGAMTGDGGANAFMTDDDPELVRDALPFALKTYESLLQADPSNKALYLATASGFIQYANAFLEEDADRLEDTDLQRARHVRGRAGRLYLRGRDYALRGLELEHPGFSEHLRSDAACTLESLDERDVPLLFWAAAGWGAAVGAHPGAMALVGDLPLVEAMMRRALELDEDFDHGAIHEFFIVYDGSRGEAMGGSPERARGHMERAIELTGGQKASPYVAYASTVAVRNQDYEMFARLLKKAADIDPSARPEWRLANVLAQERAKWLLGRSAELFIDYEEE